MFGDKATFAHDLSRNRDFSRKAIAEYRAAGGTALYDAMTDSLVRIRNAEGRRVVVVMTDGRDEDNAGKGPGSTHRLEDVLKLVKDSGAMIYAIGLGTNPDRAVLQQMADLSGGRAFFPADVGTSPRSTTASSTTCGGDTSSATPHRISSGTEAGETWRSDSSLRRMRRLEVLAAIPRQPGSYLTLGAPLGGNRTRDAHIRHRPRRIDDIRSVRDSRVLWHRDCRWAARSAGPDRALSGGIRRLGGSSLGVGFEGGRRSWPQADSPAAASHRFRPLGWAAVPMLLLTISVGVTGTGIDVLLVAFGCVALLGLERTAGDWLGELVGSTVAGIVFAAAGIGCVWYFFFSATGSAQSERFFAAAEDRGYTTAYYHAKPRDPKPSPSSTAASSPPGPGQTPATPSDTISATADPDQGGGRSVASDNPAAQVQRRKRNRRTPRRPSRRFFRSSTAPTHGPCA